MKLSRTIRDDDVDIDTVDVDILPFYGLNCCYFRVRETVVGQEVNTWKQQHTGNSFISF